MDLLRKLFLLGLLIALSANSLGQDNFILDNLIEELLQEGNVNEAESWIEYLYYLKDNPLNLNTASREDLLQLQFLTPYQIENLHSYIYEYGALESIYELMAVSGFDKISAQRLALFAVIGISDEILYKKYTRKDTTFVKGETIIRTGRTLEKLKGSNGDFLGMPWQLGIKTKVEAGNYRFGIAYDKDVGETFWDTQNRTPEFLAFSAEYKSDGVLKNLIIGNFRVNFGQGLGLWQNFGFGKSSMVLSNLKTSRTIQAHTSASEFNYFRGSAAMLSTKNLDYCLFVSSNKIDAGLSNDSLNPFINSDYQTGYHRTQSEMNRKDQLRENAYGANVQWSYRRLRLSANVHQIIYDKPLEESANLFMKSYGAASADYLLTFPSLMIWGELASDYRGNIAVLNGLQLFPADNLSLSLLWREFPDYFYARYSLPFSEGGKAENESGLYMGVEFLPLPGLKIQSYADVFYFKREIYNADGATSGFEILNKVSYSWNRNVEFYLKLKFEEKEKNYLGELNNEIRPYLKSTLRLNLKIKAFDLFSSQSRLEFVRNTISGKPETGWMLFQDLQFDGDDGSWGIDARFALFNTDSYYTGIYAYEPDVLHAFSVPVYYGSGLRYVLNAKVKLTGKTTLYFKFGRFKYFDREIISSGVSEIRGSLKTDLRLQLRCRF